MERRTIGAIDSVCGGLRPLLLLLLPALEILCVPAGTGSGNAAGADSVLSSVSAAAAGAGAGGGAASWLVSAGAAGAAAVMWLGCV